MRSCDGLKQSNARFSFILRIRWLNKNPALKEFDDKHAFFRGLIMSIGKEMRHRATWTKVILSVGSGLFSMIDMGSDVVSIILYRSRGLDDVAFMMTVFVLLSLGMQLLVVIVIHYKNKRRMLIEIVGTLTFTKAGLNKYRVLTNTKVVGHEIMPPVAEMMVFKIVEVVAESIPMVSAVKLRKICERNSSHTPPKLSLNFADGAANARDFDQ